MAINTQPLVSGFLIPVFCCRPFNWVDGALTHTSRNFSVGGLQTVLTPGQVPSCFHHDGPAEAAPPLLSSFARGQSRAIIVVIAAVMAWAEPCHRQCCHRGTADAAPSFRCWGMSPTSLLEHGRSHTPLVAIVLGGSTAGAVTLTPFSWHLFRGTGTGTPIAVIAHWRMLRRSRAPDISVTEARPEPCPFCSQIVVAATVVEARPEPCPVPANVCLR